MRPDALRTARIATAFYAVVAFLSVVYAFLFGHVDRLLGERAPDGAGLLLGLGTGLAVVAVSNLMLMRVKSVQRAADAMGHFLGPLGMGTSVYLALLSGFAEELCFRGALWPQLGLIGTTILFGVLHAVPSRDLALYPLFAAFGGLLFGLLRERTGSVWPPVIAHFTVNAINLAVLGARERRRIRELPPAPEPPREPEEPPAVRMPAGIGQVASFPITIWRYDLRVELRGTDRESLQECLEHEELALFQRVPREEVYRQFGEGQFVFCDAFAEPFMAFAADIATISNYLFQPVFGIEVAERYAEPEVTDDVRAWKVVAQRGEWVKVPLVVEPAGGGKFHVDADRDDEEVLAAHWTEYPRWFQDGMRFKYPRLRDL
ncbi:MAG: lysostaphin resistance A-like protein [Planctomycetota bacterium]